MPIVIGLAPGERGTASASLGAMIARSTGSSLVVAAVTPTPWPPKPFVDDHEFTQLQQQAAREALDRTRAIIGPELDAAYMIEPARSVTSGLLDVAERHDASLLVLGSSVTSPEGRITFGSIASRILHSLDRPVCFAPAGYTVQPTAKVSRLTVGFGRSDRDSGLLRNAVEYAKRLDIPLRVACFAVRSSAAGAGTIEPKIENLVAAEWADRVRAQIHESLAATDISCDDVDIAIGVGTSWPQAVGSLTWLPTDVLAIGVSTTPVGMVLLGSHASKIIRSSPVPALTVPRSMAEG